MPSERGHIHRAMRGPRRLSGRFGVILAVAFLVALGGSFQTIARPMTAEVVDPSSDPVLEVRPDVERHGTAPPASSPLLAFTPFISLSEAIPVVPSGRYESLKDVLRSAVNVQSATRPASRGVVRKPGTDTEEGGRTVLDRALQAAYLRLLDSEMLGAAVREVVQIEIDQRARKTFSLLGMGHFAVDADAGQLNLSENWTGGSLSLTNAPQQGNSVADGGQQPTVTNRPQEGQFLLSTVIKRVISIFDGPEGTLLLIILVLILVPAGVVRVLIHFARRRPSSLRAVR
jgi:hypothetical protein